MLTAKQVTVTILDQFFLFNAQVVHKFLALRQEVFPFFGGIPNSLNFDKLPKADLIILYDEQEDEDNLDVINSIKLINQSYTIVKMMVVKSMNTGFLIDLNIRSNTSISF